MSAEHEELPGEEAEWSWRERVAAVADAWSALIPTRAAIFREELAAKALALLKAVIAVAIGLGVAAGALLLLAAFLAALLAQWFHNVALGILGALVLYAAGAAVAVLAARKALGRVKLTEFPASSEELRRDWSALKESWSAPETPGEGETPSPGAPGAKESGREDRAEDLEERYRAGAE